MTNTQKNVIKTDLTQNLILAGVCFMANCAKMPFRHYLGHF
jgi:hypothetical protein